MHGGINELVSSFVHILCTMYIYIFCLFILIQRDVVQHEKIEKIGAIRQKVFNRLVFETETKRGPRKRNGTRKIQTLLFDCTDFAHYAFVQQKKKPFDTALQYFVITIFSEKSALFSYFYIYINIYKAIQIRTNRKIRRIKSFYKIN